MNTIREPVDVVVVVVVVVIVVHECLAGFFLVWFYEDLLDT